MKIIVTFETDSSLHPDTKDFKTIEEIREYLFNNNDEENMNLISVDVSCDHIYNDRAPYGKCIKCGKSN